MTTSSDAAERFSRPRAKALLWASVLAGPLAWFLHLTLSYASMVFACRHGIAWAPHAVTLGVLVLPVAGAWIGWHSLRGVHEAGEATAPNSLRRSRFMAIGGIALSLYFLAIVLLAEIPNLVFGPCR